MLVEGCWLLRVGQGNPPSPLPCCRNRTTIWRAKAGLSRDTEEEVVVADHILSTAFLVTCTVATGVCLVYIFSKQWRN